MKNVVLPGLLIEYLVIGSVALLWVATLVEFIALENSVPTIYLLALTPGIYVLGMVVEFLAFVLVSFPGRACLKTWIRIWVERRHLTSGPTPSNGASGQGTAQRQISIHLDAVKLEVPDLATQVEIRSSRDRIARGTWMNFAICAIVLSAQDDSSNFTAFGYSVSHTCLAVVAMLMSFGMWIYFEASSYIYEHRLAQILRERLNC